MVASFVRLSHDSRDSALWDHCSFSSLASPKHLWGADRPTRHSGTSTVLVFKATAGTKAYSSGKCCLLPDGGVFSDGLLSPV